MSYLTSWGLTGLALALLLATTGGHVDPFCEIEPARHSIQVIRADRLPPRTLRAWLWAYVHARLRRGGWALLGLFLLTRSLGLPPGRGLFTAAAGVLLFGVARTLGPRLRSACGPHPRTAAPRPCAQCPHSPLVPAPAPLLPGVAPGCTSCTGADPFAWIYHDPLVQRYQRLFRWLDLAALPPCPHPNGLDPAVYIKTFLVAVEERHTQSFERFHRFLLEHPALIVFLGYRLQGVDPTQPFGFDPAATLVSARHFKRKLQELPHAYVQHLLLQTVAQLADAGLLKDCIAAVDVAEVWARVAANNPKAYVPQRYDKKQTQRGAPSARLGVKATSNQGGKKAVTRSFWGWKSGAIAVRTPHGLVCLHDLTQPANVADVNFFRPLLQPLQEQLGLHLLKIVADAAFDARQVYLDTRDQGGTAYIALNTRGHAILQHRFGPHGRLLCADGREMDNAGQWFDQKKGYHRGRFTCPFYNSKGQRKQALLGQTCQCQHAQFAAGGCRHTLNLDDPDQVRFAVDRGSRDFKETYARRTDAERLFALAEDYHLERPEVESLTSVANLNTLLYLVLNVHTLEAAATAGAVTPP